jgi:hypothetical protein
LWRRLEIGGGENCSARPFAEALGGNPKRAVELAGHVLKGNEDRQFDNSVIVEMVSKALDHVVLNALVGPGHGLGIIENGLLTLIEQVTRPPKGKRMELLQTHTPLEQGAELMSTQKGQSLICETRTVTSERKAGSIGEERRSIMP